VLSACETAGGRALEGEAVLSLSRSFLRAGAGATIATLWDVGPQSAAFSDALHGALRAGRKPADALHRAKQKLRASGAEPFVWAPYKLITR
jgi:CHAT domain-containing protein